MTTTTLTADEGAEFIDTLLTENKTWRPPVYPEWSSPLWERAWETSTEGARKNLARAWLWRMSDKMHNSHGRNYAEQQHHVFEEKHQWLATIQPYLDADDFSKHHLVWAIFLGNETSGYDHINWLKTIWFGTPEQKAETLLNLECFKRDPGEKPATLSNIYQLRAWEITKEPWAKKEHVACAQRLTFLLGLQKMLPIDSMPDHQQAWQILGYRGAHPDSQSFFDVTPTDLHAVVSQAEPWLGVSIVRDLIQYACDATGFPDKGILALAADVAKVCTGAVTPFNVLRTWCPTYHAIWDATEAMGVHYTEACQMALAQPTRNIDQHAASLPADITFDTSISP